MILQPLGGLNLFLLTRCFGGGHQQIELVCPIYEGFDGVTAGLVGAGTFELMQHFVASVHAWTGFMLAEEGDRVRKRANNAAVPQMQRRL
jgi:hypothetical protein